MAAKKASEGCSDGRCVTHDRGDGRSVDGLSRAGSLLLRGLLMGVLCWGTVSPALAQEVSESSPSSNDTEDANGLPTSEASVEGTGEEAPAEPGVAAETSSEVETHADAAPNSGVENSVTSDANGEAEEVTTVTLEVRLTEGSESSVLHRVLPSEWEGAPDTHEQLCEGACTHALAPGTYRFALSSDGGTPISGEDEFEIQSPGVLTATYTDNAGIRAGGWVVFTTLMAAGVALCAVGIFENMDALMYSGLGTIPLAAAGLPLALWGDSAVFRFE